MTQGGSIELNWARIAIQRGMAILIALSCLQGCRSARQDRNEVLEAELRTRERELAEAKAELNGVRGLQFMQIQGQPIPGGTSSGLREIGLGIGTGGFDADGQTGDEGLQVIIVPKDADGSAIKAAGSVQVVAYDLANDGFKRPIGLWELTPDQLRSYWQKGFLSSGYKLQLRWHSPPTNSKVRIAVKLQAIGGQVFETDKDITVKVLQ